VRIIVLSGRIFENEKNKIELETSVTNTKHFKKSQVRHVSLCAAGRLLC